MCGIIFYMILLVGNWKVAPETQLQAVRLAQKTSIIAKKHKKDLVTVICTPAVHLAMLPKQKLAPLFLGAQSVSPINAIAQTGLHTAALLKDAGAQYCLVGHSEARARGESNDHVVSMIERLLEKKIHPIVCVGEKERDDHGWYLGVIKEQIETVCSVVPKQAFKTLIIAYEPVWAIGASAVREATPVECREIITYIRKLISDLEGEKIAASVTILYGGSVNEKNALSFISEGGANGLLVGRTSLDPKAFGALAASIVPTLTAVKKRPPVKPSVISTKKKKNKK